MTKRGPKPTMPTHCKTCGAPITYENVVYRYKPGTDEIEAVYRECWDCRSKAQREYNQQHMGEQLAAQQTPANRLKQKKWRMGLIKPTRRKRK